MIAASLIIVGKSLKLPEESETYLGTITDDWIGKPVAGKLTSKTLWQALGPPAEKYKNVVLEIAKYGTYGYPNIYRIRVKNRGSKSEYADYFLRRVDFDSTEPKRVELSNGILYELVDDFETL